MKLEVLRTATRRAAVDLKGARGVVAFVSGVDTVWGDYLAAVRAAFASRGRLRGAGTVVRGSAGVATVGTAAFESLLGTVLEDHALRREEYAAVWLGIGTAEHWVSAAVALLHGPVTTRRIRERGEQAESGAATSEYGPGAAAEWVRPLVREAKSDMERLGRTQSDTAELESCCKELREAAAVVQGDAEAAAMAWVRERQDAETRLLLYRDREKVLRARLKRIRKAGEDAACGRCGQPLQDRAETVEHACREEWEAVVQDGKWWRRRRDQLELKPEELKAIESRALSLKAEIEDLSEELERRKIQALDLDAVIARLEQLRELEVRLAGSPGGALDTPDARASRDGGVAVPDTGAAGGATLAESADSLVDAARKRVRARIHAKLVALTGGRFAGAFPGLYADWIAGNRGGGEDMAALELATRITLAELATEAGMELESIVLPTGLERLNAEDLPRALADLVRLARRIPLVLVKATPRVVARAPESFDLLYRIEGAGKGQRVRRRQSGMAMLWLRGD